MKQTVAPASSAKKRESNSEFRARIGKMYKDFFGRRAVSEKPPESADEGSYRAPRSFRRGDDE